MKFSYRAVLFLIAAIIPIFGLTNDAHGYIIAPDSWRHKTMESELSFGGEDYGDITETRAKSYWRTMLLAAETV